MIFETLLQRLEDEYLVGYILNMMDPLIDYEILTEARYSGYDVEIPTPEMISLIENGRALRVAILALEKDLMNSFRSAIRKYVSGGKYIFFQYMPNETPLIPRDIIEIAIRENRLETVEFMMNILNFDVNHLLRLATELGREEIMRSLVSRGADDYEGALVGTNDENIIEYLLDRDIHYNEEVLQHLIELGNPRLIDKYLRDRRDLIEL